MKEFNEEQLDIFGKTLALALEVRSDQVAYFKEGSSLRKKELLKKSKSSEQLLDRYLLKAKGIYKDVTGEELPKRKVPSEKQKTIL